MSDLAYAVAGWLMAAVPLGLVLRKLLADRGREQQLQERLVDRVMARDPVEYVGLRAAAAQLEALSEPEEPAEFYHDEFGFDSEQR
jgi:hypothetical protein